MFNKYVNEYVTNEYGGPSEVNVNVTENRAPTDESIKILNDMHEKAAINVLRTYISDNIVCCSWNVSCDLASNMKIARGLIKINGSDHVFSERLSVDVANMSFDNIFAFVHEKITEFVAQEIAREITYSFFEGAALRK